MSILSRLFHPGTWSDDEFDYIVARMTSLLLTLSVISISIFPLTIIIVMGRTEIFTDYLLVHCTHYAEKILNAIGVLGIVEAASFSGNHIVAAYVKCIVAWMYASSMIISTIIGIILAIARYMAEFRPNSRYRKFSVGTFNIIVAMIAIALMAKFFLGGSYFYQYLYIASYNDINLIPLTAVAEMSIYFFVPILFIPFAMMAIAGKVAKHVLTLRM